jgi:hypothetical protein
MVRPMLERTKRTIRAEDVRGVKELRKLGPLLRVATGLQACRSTELALCRYGGGSGLARASGPHAAGVGDGLCPATVSRRRRRDGGDGATVFRRDGTGQPRAGLGELRCDRLKPVLRTASQPIAPREAVRNPESRRFRSGLLGQREPRAEQDWLLGQREPRAEQDWLLGQPEPPCRTGLASRPAGAACRTGLASRPAGTAVPNRIGCQAFDRVGFPVWWELAPVPWRRTRVLFTGGRSVSGLAGFRDQGDPSAGQRPASFGAANQATQTARRRVPRRPPRLP